MVRIFCILLATLMMMKPAIADFWVDYLEIRCEPTISAFSVRPTGVENYEGKPPKGFFTIDQNSDYFSDCLIKQNNSEYHFEVIRTESFPPSVCHNCGQWVSRFEIRLNGKVLSNSLVGRPDMSPLDTIYFNGFELFSCQTISSYSPRGVIDEQRRVSRGCTIVDLSKYKKQ